MPKTAIKTAMIRARIQPSVKKDAEDVLVTLGLTPTEAITLFYKQVALYQGLPFPVRIPNARTRKAMRDALTGDGLRDWSDLSTLKATLG